MNCGDLRRPIVGADGSTGPIAADQEAEPFMSGKMISGGSAS
jgi:hypothetical protein